MGLSDNFDIYSLGLVTLALVLAGILIGWFYRSAVTKSMNGYQMLIAWHICSFFTFLLLLSLVVIFIRNPQITVNALISSAIVWSCFLGSTFVMGYHIPRGIWWKTSLVVILSFCFEFPLYRLVSTIWIVVAAAR